MYVSIEREVLEKYPEAKIGYLLAKVSVKKVDLYVESLKKKLLENLLGRGFNVTNFAARPEVACWRKIYQEDFHVKDKSYRSSLEALLRRVLTGREIWHVSNVVDLYNCCSLFSLLPMGGYDLSKLSGDISIRFAKEGEPFQGIGEREQIETKANHVIYADRSRVLCWLWNYKDSSETSIDANTKDVLFFIDSVQSADSVSSALQLLSEHLQKIECHEIDRGILSGSTPQARLL